MKLKRLIKKNRQILLVILFQLGVNLLWAWSLPFNEFPDECLHFKTAHFFYHHLRLPVAGKEKITFVREPNCFGTTYLTAPFLNYMIAAFFIPVGSLVGIQNNYLAARMSSVVFGVIFTFFLYKFLEELFGHQRLIIFSVVLSTIMIPQVMFIFSALNAESYSLAVSAFLLFTGLSFFKLSKKKLKKSKPYFLLGLAVSLQLFAKYNFYLLLAVPAFLVFQRLRKREFFVRKSLLGLAVVFLLSGWFFIRNQILYDDFLGLKTYRSISRAHLSGHSYGNLGWTYYDLLFKSAWLQETADSFYGRFGYMTIHVDPTMQWIFRSFVFIGLVGLIKKLSVVKNLKKLFKNNLLYLLFVFLMPINVFISLSNSLQFDFQNQGRYLFPILVPLMILANKGVFGLTKTKDSQKTLAIAIIFGSILLNFWSFLYLPKV